MNEGTGFGHLAGREGGCLIVYHHGAIPVDYMYTVAGVYIATGKIVHSIVHRDAGQYQSRKSLISTLDSMIKHAIGLH